MTPRPDVSVCIVSWNSGDLVCEAAASAFASCGALDVEVIVVDNASTDESMTRLRERVPAARVIANSVNGGFARGNNQAFREARGRYLLLLNDDARLLGNALATMVGFADTNPRVGMVGCRVRQPDGIIQLTLGVMPTLRRTLFADRHTQRLEQELAFGTDLARRRALMAKFVAERRLDTRQEAPYASGVCLLVRRAVLDQVGELDEGFLMYYEDIDWCLRAGRAGWITYYLPDAEAEHRLRPLSAKPAPSRLALAARLAQRRFLRRYSGLAAASLLTLAGFAGFLTKAGQSACHARWREARHWTWAAARIIWPSTSDLHL